MSFHVQHCTATWWNNSHILSTTKCEYGKTPVESHADTLHSTSAVTVLVPQIDVILMQARNVGPVDLSNNKFICRGTLAHESALRKTCVFLSADSYSIVFASHCFPIQSTLKLLSLWTLLSAVPLFIILPGSFVLSSSQFRQNIALDASCISLHRAGQMRQPVFCWFFFPSHLQHSSQKKTNFRCSGTLCYSLVALIKKPIIEKALQLSMKVWCCSRWCIFFFYQACKRPVSPLQFFTLWFIKAAVVSPHSSAIWPLAGDSGAWLRTVCGLTTPPGWVGALPLFHRSPPSSAGQTGSSAPLLPPPPPHCLSVRLRVRNMMERDFWTVRRLSPFVPPAEWEWKLGNRRGVQMSVVGRRDKSGDPQWL